MKSFDTKWVKYIGGAVGGIAAGFIFMFGGIKIVYPAVSELVGLSVAQSSTLWNSVVDAAKGDSLTSGILGTSPYLFNGVSFDRARGTGGAANVTAVGTGTDNTANSTAKVPVIPCRANAAAPSWTEGFMVPCSVDLAGNSRTTGSITGAVTPADGFTNPTTAINGWSLLGLFNGTTWDRARGSITNGLLVEKKTVGATNFNILRADITTASVNLAFGFTSRKILVSAPAANTQNICIDWLGGTAVCPAANTAGDGVLVAGTSILLDDFAGTSISIIAASGTQSFSVSAWN